VLALRGRVMGTEEASARLHEQVALQAKEFSTLENFRVAEELGIKDINEYRLAQVELKRLSIK